MLHVLQCEYHIQYLALAVGAVETSLKVVRPLQAIYLFFMAVRITCHHLSVTCMLTLV